MAGGLARKHRLQKNFQAGIILHSDHSGVGTAEIAMNKIQDELLKRGYLTDTCMTCHRACDPKEAAQRILQSWQKHTPDHLHVDIMEALKEDAHARLLSMA